MGGRACLVAVPVRVLVPAPVRSFASVSQTRVDRPDPAAPAPAGSGLRNASPAQQNPPHLAPYEPSATKSACARSARAHLAQCDPRWPHRIHSPGAGLRRTTPWIPEHVLRLPRNEDAQAAPVTLMAQSADSPRGGNAQTGAILHALKRNSTRSLLSLLSKP